MGTLYLDITNNVDTLRQLFVNTLVEKTNSSGDIEQYVVPLEEISGDDKYVTLDQIAGLAGE